MDTLSDKYDSNSYRPNPFSIVLNTILGFVRWLAGFFMLTEEDKLAAGISVDGKDRDG